MTKTTSSCDCWQQSTRKTSFLANNSGFWPRGVTKRDRSQTSEDPPRPAICPLSPLQRHLRQKTSDWLTNPLDTYTVHLYTYTNHKPLRNCGSFFGNS